jgi:hypothetical protein
MDDNIVILAAFQHSAKVVINNITQQNNKSIFNEGKFSTVKLQLSG